MRLLLFCFCCFFFFWFFFLHFCVYVILAPWSETRRRSTSGRFYLFFFFVWEALWWHQKLKQVHNEIFYVFTKSSSVCFCSGSQSSSSGSLVNGRFVEKFPPTLSSCCVQTFLNFSKWSDRFPSFPGITEDFSTYRSSFSTSGGGWS